MPKEQKVSLDEIAEIFIEASKETGDESPLHYYNIEQIVDLVEDNCIEGVRPPKYWVEQALKRMEDIQVITSENKQYYRMKIKERPELKSCAINFRPEHLDLLEKFNSCGNKPADAFVQSALRTATDQSRINYYASIDEVHNVITNPRGKFIPEFRRTFGSELCRRLGYDTGNWSNAFDLVFSYGNIEYVLDGLDGVRKATIGYECKKVYRLAKVSQPA